MIDHNNDRHHEATGSRLSKSVQLHVIRLTLNHLDQQLLSMRESDGESVVEDIIEKTRTSTFIRTVVERELKRRDQGDQLFARVEGMVQALRAADDEPVKLRHQETKARFSIDVSTASIGVLRASVARLFKMGKRRSATNLFI